MGVKMYIPKGGVAFFDSGVGGLTVLDSCRKLLPNECFYYYGDNANAPYGNRPTWEIKQFVERAFALFQQLNACACVIACNTVTAVCIEELRKEYAFPIIGAEPAVLPAFKLCQKVLVLATKATRQSNRFLRLKERAQRMFPSVSVEIGICDELAGIIEQGIERGKLDVTAYLPKTKADAVVLGCTHYVYAKKQIQDFYACPVFDGNDGIANRLVTLLREKTPQGRDRQPLVTPTKAERGNGANFEVFQGKKEGAIFFLGSGKTKNKTIYERMFAIP